VFCTILECPNKSELSAVKVLTTKTKISCYLLRRTGGLVLGFQTKPQPITDGDKAMGHCPDLNLPSRLFPCGS